MNVNTKQVKIIKLLNYSRIKDSVSTVIDLNSYLLIATCGKLHVAQLQINHNFLEFCKLK